MCRGHFLPLRSISHTHQQVFLYLFVKFIKLLFSLVQGYAGVMVALFPGFKVVRVQVLVGQSQRAEAVAGVLLWGREGWERLAAACRGTDEGPLTFRCEVVASFSFRQDGWSLSKTMVSAPLQYSVSLPSGLRTGATGARATIRSTNRSNLLKTKNGRRQPPPHL